MKLKSIFTENKTINKTKRQPTKWEKIFTNDAADKSVISERYSCTTQQQQQQKYQQSGQKVGRRSKQIFLHRKRRTDGQQAHEKKFLTKDSKH